MDEVYARNEPAFDTHFPGGNNYYDHQVGNNPFVPVMLKLRHHLNEKKLSSFKKTTFPNLVYLTYIAIKNYKTCLNIRSQHFKPLLLMLPQFLVL